jgi:hypothetical protein
MITVRNSVTSYLNTKIKPLAQNLLPRFKLTVTATTVVYHLIKKIDTSDGGAVGMLFLRRCRSLVSQVCFLDC